MFNSVFIESVETELSGTCFSILPTRKMLVCTAGFQPGPLFILGTHSADTEFNSDAKICGKSVLVS